MGQYQFIVALLFSSLVGVFIFFRLFETYFYNSSPSDTSPPTIKEDRLFTLPLIGVSASILLLGLTFSFWHQFILNIIPVGLR